MLVIGASLLVRSFSHVMQVDAGFHTTGVIKAEYQLPASRYPVDFSKWPNLVEIHAFTARLLQRASQLPGVDAVAVSGTHPLDPGFTNSFQVVGPRGRVGQLARAVDSQRHARLLPRHRSVAVARAPARAMPTARRRRPCW